MSEANQVRIAMRPSGSTENFQIINRTNDALNTGTETTRSNTIRSDRKRDGQKVVTQTVGGTVDFEFTADDFDTILAAAMCNSWATDTPTAGTDQLAVGTATTKFDILKSYLDEDRHVLFKEMEVGQLQFTMNSGERVTGQVTFMGTEAELDFDPSTETFDDPSNNLFMDASNNISSLMIDGSAVDNMVITGMSLNINNNHQSGQGLGTQFQYHDKGSADITGSMTFRFSADAYDLWKNTITNTPVSTSFTLGDGTTDYTFKKGKEYLSGDLPSGGLDAILSLELDTVVATDDSNEMLLIERTTT